MSLCEQKTQPSMWTVRDSRGRFASFLVLILKGVALRKTVHISKPLDVRSEDDIRKEKHESLGMGSSY